MYSGFLHCVFCLFLFCICIFHFETMRNNAPRFFGGNIFSCIRRLWLYLAEPSQDQTTSIPSISLLIGFTIQFLVHPCYRSITLLQFLPVFLKGKNYVFVCVKHHFYLVKFLSYHLINDAEPNEKLILEIMQCSFLFVHFFF